MLEVFHSMTLCPSLYERACAFALKLWLACPAFLQQRVIACVVHLVLVNRKSLEFLITIREKVLNSKFWIHRKNYIAFYSTIKRDTSFDMHRLFPTLVYKNLVTDRSFGVRMTLLQHAPLI
jgi:hypothetical protein